MKNIELNAVKIKILLLHFLPLVFYVLKKKVYPGDLKHSIVNRDKNNIVFPSSNLLRDQILIILTTHTQKITIMWHGREANGTKAIRTQQINVSNQHVLCLNIHNVIHHIYFK